MDAAGDAEFSDFMHGRWFQLVRLGYGLIAQSAAALRIAGGGRAHVFAVASGVRLLSWTALDAAGKQVGAGPGWKCG